MRPDYGCVVEEMIWLQVDYDKQRVDHLPNKAKDSSDCLAAIAHRLTITPSWQLVDKVEGAGYAAAVSHAPLGGQVTGYGSPSAMDMVRVERGMPAR